MSPPPITRGGHKEQEGRALRRKEPPPDATFAHTPIVFCTNFGDVLLELDRRTV